MKIAGSWSGGKDGCLASSMAVKEGHELVCLFNTVSVAQDRSCFHGLPTHLIQLQANQVGVPLVMQDVGADPDAYGDRFREGVEGLKADFGIEGMVFGDIHTDQNREWVEAVCRDVGLTAIEPLWHKPTPDVARLFVAEGFRATIVACKADILGEDFIGREFDAALLADLEKKGICPCGENGEFHTYVTAGPLFKNRIEILESEKILKQGFWEHWTLDIREARAVEA